MEGFISGLHKSPFHGFSVEFSEHRLYNAGESTKNIDWKLYGRTDKLFVKRFEEETNLRCQIVLDHSRSMLFPLESHLNLDHPNKLTFSIYASALLTEMMLRQRDAFGLTLVSDGIDLQTEVRGSVSHQRHLFGILEQELRNAAGEESLRHISDTSPAHLAIKSDNSVSETSRRRRSVVSQKSSIAESLHLTAELLKQRSLVVIFTDAFFSHDERESMLDALRHMRHCKHEVILFHTLSHSMEVDLGFANKPTEFVDMESGKRMKLNPSDVAEQYVAKMNAQVDEIRRRAIQYQVDYVPIDIDAGFEPMLMPYLMKRNKYK